MHKLVKVRNAGLMGMRKLHTHQSGYVVIVDAVVFLVIMMIASVSAFQYFHSGSSHVVEIRTHLQEQRYCSETGDALLSSTVSGCWYRDNAGNVVHLPKSTLRIRDILSAELSLLCSGTKRSGFTSNETIGGFYSIECAVNRTARRLVETSYHFGILYKTSGAAADKSITIYISDAAGGIPETRYASEFILYAEYSGKIVPVPVFFYIWQR